MLTGYLTPVFEKSDFLAKYWLKYVISASLNMETGHEFLPAENCQYITTFLKIFPPEPWPPTRRGGDIATRSICTLILLVHSMYIDLTLSPLKLY